MKKGTFLSLKPMLLEEIAKPFNKENFLYEIKYDGFRALIYVKKKEIIIKSRNGTILNDIFPELEKIKDVVPSPCVLDGEIIYLDNGKPNIRPLQERLRTKDKIKKQELQQSYPALFACFDILDNGTDLTQESLIKRKAILANFCENEVFHIVKFYLAKGQELFKAIQAADLEGIVAKEINSLYYPGKRVNFWLKIKNLQSAYFFIGGYTFNLNNTISLYLGEKNHNLLLFVGKLAISNKHELYNQIVKRPRILKSPFYNYADPKCLYVKPKIEIFVYYTARTNNNMLRHPKL